MDNFKLTDGDLVISLEHIPEAQVPYLIVLVLKDYYVCVSCDNQHTVNLKKEKVKQFKISNSIIARINTYEN